MLVECLIFTQKNGHMGQICSTIPGPTMYVGKGTDMATSLYWEAQYRKYKKKFHGALHRSEVYQCGLIRLCHNIDVQAVMGLEVEYGTSKVTSRGYRVLGYCSGCT